MDTGNSVVIRDPEVLGGTPVFRGTRVPFQTLNEFLDDFPTVTRETAVHALEYAKALLVSELG